MRAKWKKKQNGSSLNCPASLTRPGHTARDSATAVYVSYLSYFSNLATVGTHVCALATCQHLAHSFLCAFFFNSKQQQHQKRAERVTHRQRKRLLFRQMFRAKCLLIYLPSLSRYHCLKQNKNVNLP